MDGPPGSRDGRNWTVMEKYQKNFARLLAETDALFFANGLKLKDGRPTPYFVNLGLFRTGRLISLLGSYLAGMLVGRNLTDRFDVLIGPSYKGSALAVAVAQALWSEHGLDRSFDYDRKEAKTHGEGTIRANMFVTNAMQPGARVFIVDDVVTTMGTKYDLLRLLRAESNARNLELTIAGVALAVDREQSTVVLDEKGRPVIGVRGEDAVERFTQKTGLPVHALAGIGDVVRYLAAEEIPVMINGVRRPIDPRTLREFEEYLDTYGVPPRGTL